MDSILRQEDYPINDRKRTSKLDSATDKILFFYSKQSNIQRELMEEF